MADFQSIIYQMILSVLRDAEITSANPTHTNTFKGLTAGSSEIGLDDARSINGQPPTHGVLWPGVKGSFLVVSPEHMFMCDYHVFKIGFQSLLSNFKIPLA